METCCHHDIITEGKTCTTARKLRDFADRSASAKIKIAASTISIVPYLPVRAGTAKISSGALRGNPVKFCTHKNFPLYGIYLQTLFKNSVVKKWLQMLPAEKVRLPSAFRFSAVTTLISLYSTTCQNTHTSHEGS